MRISMPVLVGCLVLAGCLGKLKLGGSGGNGNGASDNSQLPGANQPIDSRSFFVCNTSSAAVTPTPIKRLSKDQVEGSIAEFLADLSAASRSAVLSAIQTRIDIIPNDLSDYYVQNDNSVTQDHVDAMFGLAVTLSTTLSGNAQYAQGMLSVCQAGATLDSDACLTSFVKHFGRKAFRRPLTDSEVSDMKTFYESAKTANTDAFGALVGRLIAHPNFYYHFDDAGQVLSGASGSDALYALSRWELLSKLTFLFWGAPPTDALYDQVQDLDITTDESLSSLVDQVLADAKAEQGVLQDFYNQWLEFNVTLRPGTDGNPLAFQTLLAQDGLSSLPADHQAAMNQEIVDLLKYYIFTTDGSFADVLESPYSFATTPELAKIYGVDPWDGTPTNLVSLPASERSGLLTRAAFVASSNEYTRPIMKGKRIRIQLLCDEVPPPPANLNITPLTHPANLTTRQATEQATADAACQSCHSQLDAPGFASENYDPLGHFRTMEARFTDGTATIAAEQPVDTAVTGVLDPTDSAQIAEAVALSKHIADSGRADMCMVRNYFRFLYGRLESESTDGCGLEAMREKLMGTGSDGTVLGPGSIRQMFKVAVMQPSFRQRKVQ